MTVYLDLVLVLNFAVNYLLLKGTALLGAAYSRSIVLASALGAVYAVLVYLPHLQWLQSGVIKLVTAALMLLCAFGCKRSTLRMGAIFAVLSFVLCGVIYAVQSLQGQPFLYKEHLLYPVSFASVLLTALAVCLACRLLLPKLSHSVNSTLPLELHLKEKRVRLTALRDSGNSLVDPLSGAPVLTVYWQAARALFPTYVCATDFQTPAALALRLRTLSPRLIPYRAVGVSEGLLFALPCHITLGTKQYYGLVAFSPTPVSDGGAYEALIGGILYA